MTSVPAASSRQRARPGFAAGLWVLRVLLVINGLLIIVQPISIGQYLAGSFGMLAVHSGVASAVIISSFLLFLAAIAYAVLGGRLWVPVVAGLLGFAVEVQFGMGYAQQLGVHVPLGVAIVTGFVLLVTWSWLPGSRRCRPRRVRAVAAQQEVGV